MLTPLRFSLEPKHRVGVIEVKYVDSPRQVVEALDRIVHQPAFHPELDLCVEYKSLGEAPSRTRLRELTARLRRFGLDHFQGRCAFVAWTPAARDAARQFVDLLRAPADKVRVFSDCQEALDWFSGADLVRRTGLSHAASSAGARRQASSGLGPM